jgi:DNA-binding CsgD family transcriptional regulator
MTCTPEVFSTFEYLPKRQKQVLALCCLGMTSDQVAAKLGLTYWAVNCYVTRVMKKTKFKRRMLLIIYVIRHPQIEKMLREVL